MIMILQKLQKRKKITLSGIFRHISVWSIAQKPLILIEWIKINSYNLFTNFFSVSQGLINVLRISSLAASATCNTVNQLEKAVFLIDYTQGLSQDFKTAHPTKRWFQNNPSQPVLGISIHIFRETRKWPSAPRKKGMQYNGSALYRRYGLKNHKNTHASETI